MTEAHYEIYLAEITGNYHYKAWIDERCGPFQESGCSIAPHWFGWNRASCERAAKRACRRLLRRHARCEESVQSHGTVRL